MSKLKKWIPLLAAAALAGGIAWAQNRVIADQGTPGNYGSWQVTGSGSGASFPTTLQQCTSRSHKITSVGVAASNCPSAQLASRRYIVICNSLENAGTPLLKIRVDGTDPVMGSGTAGDVLGVGDCVTYPIAASVVPRCIASAAATATSSFECL